jgi:hypothetical protein
MLTIVGQLLATEGCVTVDEYVPLSFRASISLRPDPFVWRIGDLDRNVFELKIDRSTGEIFAATLLIFDQKPVPISNSLCDQCDLVQGLPVADVSRISSAIADERASFRLAHTESCVAVFFDEPVVPTKCFQNGRVRFLVEGDTLVGVSFDELTVEEMLLVVTRN